VPPGLVARLRAAGCVFAEEEAALLVAEARGADDLERMAASRVAGAPLEVVVGWAELCGLRIAVEPGVFVPRRRTALMAVRAAASARPGAVVVDLCCGTGAVAAVVLARQPQAEVWAADLDPAAVACARRNLPPGQVREGDLYDALPAGLRGRVDVLACNAPYVPTAEIALMPPEARDHEHRVALDGGGDGLDVQRRVIALAPQWLAPGGTLLVESSRAQAPGSAALMAAAGLAPEVEVDDEIGATLVLGRRRAATRR
jgi:release factor glutamine methyltransferase